MVGRELQKIRPYGEDRQGLVRGREGVGPASRHSNGKKMDDSKKLTVMKTMGKVLDWMGRSLATSCVSQGQIWVDVHVVDRVMMTGHRPNRLMVTLSQTMGPAVPCSSPSGTKRNCWCKRLWNAYIVHRCWEGRMSSCPNLN